MPGLKQLRVLWWTLFVSPILAIVGWLVAFFSTNPLTVAAGPFGLAIIVVAITVRILLLALLPYQLAVSQRSRQATAANEALIAPELARLRKRFAKNPTAFGQATIDLYRRHGINPLAPTLTAFRSSLLPMVIQLPILAAVYTVIRMYAASPLAGQHLHFLWIPSLAGTDPFFILPLLVALTSFLLLRLTAKSAATPTPAGPANRGSMGFVYPVAMALTTQFVPAALAIYWIAGNLAAMVQQYVVNIRLS